MSERDKYVSEFNQWSKKTAQMILEMGRVVYEAKKELGSQDFLKFCNAINRKGEDATVRKYLAIGSKYAQFFQYANLLPNAWTSIGAPYNKLRLGLQLNRKEVDHVV